MAAPLSWKAGKRLVPCLHSGYRLHALPDWSQARYHEAMGFLTLKFILSACVVVLVSEVAKRSGTLGGLIGSIPVISMMSFIWLYIETRNTQAVSTLSYSIALFIIPSMAMF